jgi:hypothetical protein
LGPRGRWFESTHPDSGFGFVHGNRVPLLDRFDLIDRIDPIDLPPLRSIRSTRSIMSIRSSHNSPEKACCGGIPHGFVGREEGFVKEKDGGRKARVRLRFVGPDHHSCHPERQRRIWAAHERERRFGSLARCFASLSMTNAGWSPTKTSRTPRLAADNCCHVSGEYPSILWEQSLRWCRAGVGRTLTPPRDATIMYGELYDSSGL